MVDVASMCQQGFEEQRPGPASVLTGMITLLRGKIYTCDDRNPWAEALVIEPPSLLHVGCLERARQVCEARQKETGLQVVEIDAGDGLLLPGFIDAHCHPLAGGTRLLTAKTYCDVSHAHGLDHALEMMRKFATDGPSRDKGAWVLGGGWRDDWFADRVPRREQLDDVFGKDTPVFLRRWDMHACWCSTRALELAGVTTAEQTLCPKGGEIIFGNTYAHGDDGGEDDDADDAGCGCAKKADPRAPVGGDVGRTRGGAAAAACAPFALNGGDHGPSDGEGVCETGNGGMDRRRGKGRECRAVGVLYDAAQELIVDVMPRLDKKARVQALYLALETMVSHGITGYLEALCKNDRQLDAYRTVYQERGDELPWGTLAVQCRSIGDVQSIKAKCGQLHDRLHLRTAKLFIDGVMESRTAALHAPYTHPDGAPTTHTGTLNFDTHELRDIVKELDRARVTTHHHCVGDKACTEALDALEAARLCNGPWDSRHTIAHLQLVRHEDVDRLAGLGVVGNYTPYWLCNTPEMESTINPSLLTTARVNSQYPIRSMLQSGACVSLGSDWPVRRHDMCIHLVDDVLDPLIGLQVAVTHVAPSSKFPPFLPHQLIPLEDAIKCYTSRAAYACHVDRVCGSLTEGKRADVVVLDRDLFRLDVGEIHQAKVVMTMVGGKVVYRADGGGGGAAEK